MKPVYQQAAMDCLRACMASLLETPLEDVPDFGDAPGQWLRLERFCEPLGVRPVGFAPSRFVPPYNTYYLAWGDGTRGMLHSCIGLNGTIVHDPYASGHGLARIDQYVIFVAFPFAERDGGEANVAE